MSDPTDLLILDSRSIMREGLCLLLAQQRDFRVVAHAATVAGAEALDVHPDVIVTGIEFPDARNGRVIDRLRARFLRSSIVVLSSVVDPATVQSVLAAGALGYLAESADVSDLLLGIRTVAGGETYLQPILGMVLARWYADNALAHSMARSLTHRQRAVLQLIAMGHTNAEIAEFLAVSIRTVESNRASVRHKLGMKKRAELVRYAREVGLVDRATVEQNLDPV